jgi:hypothetical protein
MAVARVTACNASDCQRKAKGEMRGVPVGSEANTAASEHFEAAQQGIIARFPCPPDSLGGLAGIYVACPFHTEATVFFVPAMHAISADEAIQAGFDRFRGGNGFDQNPDLDHIASLPVVGRGFKSGRDNHTVAIFMKDKSVAHREPPLITVKRMLWPVVSLGPVGYPMKAANSTMERFLV